MFAMKSLVVRAIKPAVMGASDLHVTVDTPVDYKGLNETQQALTAYIALDYLHKGLSAELAMCAYEALCEVSTKVQFHATRKLFAEAYDRDYVARFPSNTAKQKIGARDVAWSRFWKRAESVKFARDSDRVRWVSPIPKIEKVAAEDGQLLNADGSIDQRTLGNNTGKGENQVAEVALKVATLAQLCNHMLDCVGMSTIAPEMKAAFVGMIERAKSDQTAFVDEYRAGVVSRNVSAIASTTPATLTVVPEVPKARGRGKKAA